MHDAAEAYVGDVSAPLKGLLPEYKAIERRVRAAIFERYFSWRDPALHRAWIEVDLGLPEQVRHADLRMLATEKRDLMGPEPQPWGEAELSARLRPVLDRWTDGQATLEELFSTLKLARECQCIEAERKFLACAVDLGLTEPT